HVRTRPTGYDENADTLLDALSDGQHVTMRCWLDWAAPIKGGSDRWFIVTQAKDAQHPGVNGWIWADLVWDQIQVPECNGTQLYNPDFLKDSRIILAQGAPTGSGYYYSVRLERFPPGWHAEITCQILAGSGADSVVPTFTLVAGATGTATNPT